MDKWKDWYKELNAVLDEKKSFSSPHSINVLQETNYTRPQIYPTACVSRVPDGSKLSGSLPDSLKKKIGENALVTEGSTDLEVSSWNATAPDSFICTTVDVCLEILVSPPTRKDAIERLVATFSDERQASVRQRWLERTLPGKPLAEACPTTLRLEPIALVGWAMDRKYKGAKNLGAWVWMQSACQALGVQPPKHMDTEPLAAQLFGLPALSAWLVNLLETGKLEAFGRRKKAVITDKIVAGDIEWLGKLACSRDLAQALALAPEIPLPLPVSAPLQIVGAA